jgi:signal transduction histidine kinase/DNA-binding NarL/FixJ family response regulator
MSNPVDYNSNSYPNTLLRILSVIETWGLGLAGPPGWISLVVPMSVALGPSAIGVWIPATIVGVMIVYQVQYLGKRMTDVAGGTPNYITRLLHTSPGFGSYAAIGYILTWLAAISINAVIISDVIVENLTVVGIHCPDSLLKVGFVLLPFIVAFSGTRALSILHLFFVLPAIGLLLIFSLYGLGWLVFSPHSPGFFPTSWPSLNWVDWAKWYYFATYATYSSETATSFVADSRSPLQTLRFLKFAAWVGVIVFLGGSWVVARLATAANLGDDTFRHLFTAALPLWGQRASLIVIFLLVSSALLVEATAVSNCSRIIYQLSLDKHLAPVFAVVSQRGVFGPALTLMLLLSLFYLLWGNAAQIVVVGNVGWFVSFMILHLGLWLQRDQPGVLWPRLSLGIFWLEVAILLTGGFTWGWRDFCIGLLLPLGVLAIDGLIRRISWAPLRAAWWWRKYQRHAAQTYQDSLMFQVSILIMLMCGTVLMGWWFRSLIDINRVQSNNHLLLILVLVVVFVGVAIACWTSLPQVSALEEARERTETLNQALEFRVEQRTTELREVIFQLEHEIQERKQTEEALQQAKEAADVANQAKGEFLSKMSHELRTPLNAILGFTQVLNRDISLSPSQKNYLGIINRAGEHLLILINDVLEMAKIESGRVELSPTSFDFYYLLDCLKELFALKAQSSGLYLSFDCAANVPQYIKTDESKLRQILINLISNAIKFTKSGTVSLRIRGADFQPSIDEQQILFFEVEDTGYGIDAAEFPSLFTPFLQTETGRKSQSGTGLGLSITRQFIQLMGGDITVSSIVGQGTIFRFHIQIHLAEASEVSTNKANQRVIGLAPNQPTYRILIVEDKWETRLLLVNLLLPIGFEVREAIDGQEAVTLALNWQPHLIWMDMNLPIMDGYTATQQIKSKTIDKPPIIIAMTASIFRENYATVLASGYDDFVFKPFREETILAKISQHLSLRYLYEEEIDKQPLSILSIPPSATPELITENLAAIPPEWTDKVYQAAKSLDEELIAQLIIQIQKSNPNTANELTDLLQKLRFDLIINYIEEYFL